ncbi:Ger(x)C family spore germination protein [Salibacterium salarium]|nr:Ger(x)C family spore germination protein [Salibacterium salarium]
MKKGLSFVFMLLLVGCNDKYIIEEVGFLHSLGLDVEKSSDVDEYLVTGVIPQIAPDAKNNRELLTSVSSSDKEALLDLARQSNRDVANGQLRNVLFGKELAEEGIQENIRTMNRDPKFGTRVQVVVVNGQANDLLSQPYTQHPEASQYIDALLEKEARLNNIPETRMHQFTRDLYDDGIDPVTPILRRGEDTVVLDGIALFDNAKYVEKIDPKSSRIFFFLLGNYSAGSLHLELGKGEDDKTIQLLFDSIQNTREMTIKNADDTEKMKIDIQISIKGSLVEYNGPLDITNKKDLRTLETELENIVENRARHLLSVLQAQGVDSIGVGKRVRNSLSYADWESLNWKETFQNIEINPHVEAEIINIGIFS